MSRGNARFHTTRWSVVLSARGRAESGRRALAELCGQYWFPLYAYLRRRGLSVDEAQDLTQGFFARLLAKGDLMAVDPGKGRFRSFLLKALQFYVANEWDRRQTIRRGGAVEHVALHFESGEPRYLSEGQQWSPEVLYERSWAQVVSERALDRLRRRYEKRGKLDEFEALRPFLTGDSEASTHRELARTLDKSSGAVKVSLHRFRKRFGEALRNEIGETVADSDQIDDELRNLIRALRL